VNLTDFNWMLGRFNLQACRTPAFEFLRWMAFLDSHESEVMKITLHRAMGIPGDRFFPGRPGRHGPLESI